MRIDEIAIDVQKLEEGDWVDDIPEMSGLRIKTKGIDNRQWRKMQLRLSGASPRNKRDDPEERQRILAILLRETALLDWEGIEDGDGKPVPFSKAQANEYLTNPKFQRFFNAALYAASVVADQRQAAIGDDVKN